MSLRNANAEQRDRRPLASEEPGGREGALPVRWCLAGASGAPCAVTGVRGGVVATRENGDGAVARASPPEAPVVLVGELYLDVASGIEVRVIDSRLPAGPAREFVVEAVDGSRPGERWLRAAAELQAVASPSPIGPRLPARRHPEGLVEAWRGAHLLAERLLERGQTMLDALEGRDRGVAFGVVADELGRLAAALRQATAVLEAHATAKATKLGGNGR